MRIEDLTLAEIVTNKPQAAAVLEAFYLDFCCRGKQKLSEALTDTNQLSKIVDVLSLIYAEKSQDPNDFENMPLDKLVDYILDVHHKYVKTNIPVIMQHVDKVVLKHGDRHPEMIRIQGLFKRISNDLINHMMKEELILFPRIKAMVSKINEGDAVIHVSVETPILVMEKEHEMAGDIMYEIRKLSNGYTPSESACMTHRLCLEELKMFEEDLHKHVHLENNILFPKSIAKEKIFNKN